MASWTPEHLAPRTLPNAKSPWAATEEERQDREKFGEAHLQVLRSLLVPLLQKLERIPDPRRPKSVGHNLTVLLVYGVFLFVLQMASRREGNRELGRPGLWEALRAVFPELAEAGAPHADTVNRLLERIDPEQLEQALREQIRSLLRHRKLQSFLVRHHYVIAIDGQQKLGRDWCWAKEALHWRRGEDVRYTAYVLEAVLVCPQGITLPISAEFCANEPAPDETPEQATARKQDCEQKAFHRLVDRLKSTFPRLKILIVADGLYPNGPIMAHCRRCKWDFMLVLPDDSLPSVWCEANGLHRLEPQQTLTTTWGDRQQVFWWVNDIEYCYGPNERLRLHVVVCQERWTTRDREGKETEHHARFAWVSGTPLSANNVVERCNRAARHRWDIEEHILACKHHGYQGTHAFSLNWNALRGWHYLLLLARLLNTLACYSTGLWDLVCTRGFRGALLFLRETYLNPWLSAERLRALRARPPQLRLII
jgi:hypothetical protein